MDFGAEHIGIAAIVAAAALVAAYAWLHRRESRSSRIATIIGGVGLMGLALLFAFEMQRLDRSSFSFEKRNACVDNLSEIGRALVLYQSDNGERTPLANWTEPMSGYIDPRYFACSLLSPYGYTMNSAGVAVDPWQISSPARVVALFDGPGGKDEVGGFTDIRWRHNGIGVFVYFDGHVKPATRESFEGLVIPYEE